MEPDNLFDTAHPVREDQDEDSTIRDENNNSGGTTEETAI